MVLSILIDVVTRRITKLLPRAGKRTVLIITALLVGGLVIAAMATVIAGVVEILTQTPLVYKRLDQIVGQLTIPGVGRFTLDDLTRNLNTNELAESIAGAVRSAGAGLTLTALYLVFLISSGRLITQRIEKIVSMRKSDSLVQVLERSVRGIEAYTYIQTLTGLLMAAVILVVMLAVGLKNALFWALAFFLLSYIPIVGVIAGSIGPTLFAIVQFPTPMQAGVVFVCAQVVSFVVGNLVLPKMQAESQNIDPAVSLLAIGVWSILWGIPGAFLAIPLTLALMYALAQFDSVKWVAILMSNDGSPLPATVIASHEDATALKGSQGVSESAKADDRQIELAALNSQFRPETLG